MRASGPPLAATNSLRIRRLRSLSSAPPMIIKGPAGMTATLGGLADSSHVSESRTLVVMRHAKAEQSGPSDYERQLSDRGMVDAAAAGTWLAARDVVPDQALVSAAVRTQQTWEALADGAGWDLEGTFEESLYEAGPESALDLVRQTEDHVHTLVVVGHNPTIASLAALLDDGEGDDDAGTEMTLGVPDRRDGRLRLRRRLEGPRRGVGDAGGLPRGPWLTRPSETTRSGAAPLAGGP